MSFLSLHGDNDDGGGGDDDDLVASIDLPLLPTVDGAWKWKPFVNSGRIRIVRNGVKLSIVSGFVLSSMNNSIYFVDGR